MNTPLSERALIKQATRCLDQSVENLNPETLARLRAARHQALYPRSDSNHIRWTWPAWGLTTAIVLVLAVMLWPWSFRHDPPLLHLEDIEMLASGESLDLYEDLDFYAWLAEHGHAS